MDSDLECLQLQADELSKTEELKAERNYQPN